MLAALIGGTLLAGMVVAPAWAGFPGVAPDEAIEVRVAGFAQSVAVDQDDDTTYLLATGPNELTVFSGTLDDSIIIPIDTNAGNVAVDSDDDTIYVTDNFSPGQLTIISGDLSDTSTVPMPAANPRGIAVHPTDDTVYVTQLTPPRLTIMNGRDLDDSVTVTVGNNPRALAVNAIDDTIYVANSNDRSISIVSPDGANVSTVSGIPMFPLTIAVHPTDGTVYVGGTFDRRMLVANADFSQISYVSFNSATASPFGITTSPDGSTVYVATNNYSDQSVALRASNLDDSYVFSVGGFPAAVAATNTTAYFANNSGQSMSVVTVPGAMSAVSPVSGATAGGTPITITGSGFRIGVTTVTVGGAPLISPVVANSTTVTGQAPPGAAGAADIVVSTWGLTTTAAGAFTYVAPPPPSPVFPPAAPREVVATPTDAAAVVTWSPPASPGSFPVSTYQVMSSPSGGACLTTALTCEVPGLINGTAYSFTVRALNGAGWSPESTPSAAVTPQAPVVPSLVITGSRAEVRGRPGIVIVGTSTLSPGAILRPWVRLAGQANYTRGAARILVGQDGAVEWSRRVSKRVYVFLSTPDRSLTSNRLVLR
jgi:DNA-binding beta-propeller fold protein YncE